MPDFGSDLESGCFALKVGAVTQYHISGITSTLTLLPTLLWFHLAFGWSVSQPVNPRLPRSNSWKEVWLLAPYLWRCLVISRHCVISNTSESGLPRRPELHRKSQGRIRFLRPYLLVNQLSSNHLVNSLGQMNDHSLTQSLQNAEVCVHLDCFIKLLFFFHHKVGMQNKQPKLHSMSSKTIEYLHGTSARCCLLCNSQ